MWVPGHREIADNERTNALVRKESANALTGPDLVSGITKATAHGPVFDCLKGQHQEIWAHVEGHWHSKLMTDTSC
jgi:hypothetical protein